jgi:predicted NAD/FAD-binding protein
MADGEHLTFDNVVFAVLPGQALRLLAGATEDERRRFSHLSDSPFQTVAHTDTGMYQGFRVARFTNAEIFLET